jgi:uncharacterized protein
MSKKKESKLKTIGIKSGKELLFILPIFFIATLIGILIDHFVPNDIINQFIGQNWLISIPIAASIGIIAPIPRYATYPIAFTLFMKGSGFGVAFALIGGEVVFESMVRDIIEIKYFGWKFFAVRAVLSVIFITLGGYAIEILL